MKAFPSLEWISSDGKKSGEGMDLRDYIAIEAMGEILHKILRDETITALFFRTPEITNECYKLADAMMKAREQ